MITFRNITLRRGDKVLLDSTSAAFVPGARIGVVGANGCGKSTLFSVLAGETHTDGGDIEMPPRQTLSRVFQETDASPRPAIDYVLDGDPELRAAEAEIIAAEAADDGERLAHAHEVFNSMDGWAARARAATVMDGLGFASTDIDRPVAEFSGGWRMRLNLAHALMRRADLLLLDEPTNHLDLDAVMWLERWLAGFRGTLFLISHDRELLDGTATEILHFDAGKLKQYSGNYSDFEVARAMALSQQAAAFKRQQRQIEKLQSFVDRFRAKATKARQAQSRIKALERMERIAPAHVDSPFTFTFRDPPGSPDPVLQLEDCRAGYGERAVIDSVSLSIQQGARFGLLGRNGAGKSTAFKSLIGLIRPTAGRITFAGQSIAGQEPHRIAQAGLGYVPEERRIFTDLTVMENLEVGRLSPRDGQPAWTPERLFTLFPNLAAMRNRPGGRMSGGEQQMLAIARTLMGNPRMVLLDEPSEGLAPVIVEQMVDAIRAMRDAGVTVLLAEQNLHFALAVADHAAIIETGRITWSGTVAALRADPALRAAWLPA